MIEIKLSIITPVFNGERFIRECIKNFIDQDCPQAEHIIIDGGSVDRTVEIIKEQAGKYPHIRWVSEKDKGQSDAMNKGITMARGKIISFLNVDDFYEPNVFNKAIKIFEGLPEPSFVAANCNTWDDEGKLKEICRPRRMRLEDLLLGYRINPHPVNPTAYFYHKSLHEKAGLYDVNIHMAMDQEFILRAVQYANIKYIDEIWGNFRLLKGTKTQKDIESGCITERDRLHLSIHRKDLTFLRRIKFYIMFVFFNKILLSARHRLSRIGQHIKNAVHNLRTGKK